MGNQPDDSGALRTIRSRILDWIDKAIAHEQEMRGKALAEQLPNVAYDHKLEAGALQIARWNLEKIVDEEIRKSAETTLPARSPNLEIAGALLQAAIRFRSKHCSDCLIMEYLIENAIKTMNSAQQTATDNLPALVEQKARDAQEYANNRMTNW